MGRPTNAAPITLRRWPGHSYVPTNRDSSQFLALVGTWQATSVAYLYGMHIRNFGSNQRCYYISGITIFNDEFDKPSMAIRISQGEPEQVRLGAVTVLGEDIFSSDEESEGEPHVNGHVNGHVVNGQTHGGEGGEGQPGPQPGPHVNGHVNGIVNGQTHGGEGGQGQPGPQPGPHVNGHANGVVNGVARGGGGPAHG